MFKRESTTRAFSSRGEKGREGERGKRVVICLCVCMCVYKHMCVSKNWGRVGWRHSRKRVYWSGGPGPLALARHHEIVLYSTLFLFFTLLWECFYVFSYSTFQFYLLLLFILFTCFCFIYHLFCFIFFKFII